MEIAKKIERYQALYNAKFNVNAVRFSPLTPEKILIASSQHFGVVGPSLLCILQVLLLFKMVDS